MRPNMQISVVKIHLSVQLKRLQFSSIGMQKYQKHFQTMRLSMTNMQISHLSSRFVAKATATPVPRIINVKIVHYKKYFLWPFKTT